MWMGSLKNIPIFISFLHKWYMYVLMDWVVMNLIACSMKIYAVLLSKYVAHEHV